MMISRSQKLSLILLLFLALLMSACGGGAATEAPTEEATEAAPTQARATSVPTATATQVDLIEDASAVADTFPCNARMVDDQGSILRVLFRQPSTSAPLVGARRGGQDILIDTVVVNDEGTWYAILENRQIIGYVLQEYILLGSACVSGAGAGAGAEAEASEEATAEATEAE